MVRASLAGVRRRVERMAAAAKVGECAREHRVVKSSGVWDDDPVPSWPEQQLGQRCVCGREVEYFHLVHRYQWRAQDARLSTSGPAT